MILPICLLVCQTMEYYIIFTINGTRLKLVWSPTGFRKICNEFTIDSWMYKTILLCLVWIPIWFRVINLHAICYWSKINSPLIYECVSFQRILLCLLWSPENLTEFAKDSWWFAIECWMCKLQSNFIVFSVKSSLWRFVIDLPSICDLLPPTRAGR